MEGIIWLIIIFFIIQKVISRAGKYKPFPPPGQRVPEEFPREEEDVPLKGPWSAPTGTEEAAPDAPLPGPWEPRPREQPKAAPPEKRETPKVKKPEKPPVRVEDTGKKREPQKRQKQELVFRAAKKQKKKSEHPLHKYLSDRDALIASVVLGEVINKRGGRSLYRRG